jgi:hypothetical protein
MSNLTAAILLSLDVLTVWVVAYFAPLWLSATVAIVVASMIIYRARSMGFFIRKPYREDYYSEDYY